MIICVTRRYLPSGEASIERTITGGPTFFTTPFWTSMSATCPVTCHSRSCFWYVVDIRLGNVRRRFLSESAILTVGPSGADGAGGIAARLSGMRTAAICLPSAVNSKLETSVASTGVFVSCRDLPVATSAIQMWVASSVCARYATLVLSGDQAAFDTRAPAGIWMAFFAPSAAEMSWMPTLLRIVSARARFAL